MTCIDGDLVITESDSLTSGVIVNGRIIIQANRVRVRDFKVNNPTALPAVDIEPGHNGIWLSGGHINANHAIGVRAQGTDTIFCSDVLIEGPSVGIRLGGPDTMANIFLVNVVLDAVTSVGLQVEPSAGGNVRNLQATNVWHSGGTAPALFNAQAGPVSTMILTNWRVSDSANPIWIAGPVENYSAQQVLYV